MWRILLSTILLLSLIACHKEHKKPASNQPIDVTDFIIEPKNIPMTFDFVGFAQSSHPVEIRARVEGYLDKISYDEGQLVKQGQLMFQLDPRQYQAEVAQAAAEVSKQKAIYDNTILTVNRLTPLYEQKAASKKDLDNATAQKLAADASVQAAQAALLNNQINLGYTTITSPITGLADKSKFREGALINPGANSLLTTVSVYDPIWVYFTISDSDILNAQEKEASREIILPVTKETVNLPANNKYVVEVIMSDGTVFPSKGRVDYASPTYDQATGTLQARAVLPNPDLILRPGQFVRVKVSGATSPQAIYVPQRALMQKKDGMYVFLIEDGKVIEQDVSVGDWYGNYQIITNGLKAGDRIVVDGINKLSEGSLVHIIGEWNPPVPQASQTSP